MTSAMEWWCTFGALELQNEALHPLHLAVIAGYDGPCSYTPCACTPNKWLSLTTIPGISAKANGFALHGPCMVRIDLTPSQAIVAYPRCLCSTKVCKNNSKSLKHLNVTVG